jgi:hypothetical protein
MLAGGTMSGPRQKPTSPASTEFESIFRALRTILAKHAGGLSVTDDTPGRYCLEGKVGPATVRAWGGKARRPTIPVAWAEIGKAYVSFHLMAASDAGLRDAMSEELRARMQGKTCFNFVRQDEALFKELEQLTARGIDAFRRAGFVVP